jgi:uncharacterized protein YbcV (DUF1398 family)
MNDAIQNLEGALRSGMADRPAVGGFPFLAEALRDAGVRRNLWYLPAMEAVYLTDLGPVVMQGEPLSSGASLIAPFDREALIAAIRSDQEGRSSFPEFTAAIWAAGVWRYEVDLDARTCTYAGAEGGEYVESYGIASHQGGGPSPAGPLGVERQTPPRRDSSGGTEVSARSVSRPAAR